MKQACVIAVEKWWLAKRDTLRVCMPAVSLALFLLTAFLFLAASQASMLFFIGDEGYGDTYILYDVLHFQKTGEIYRDLSLPPYLPAQYGPLVYMMYAVPRWDPFANPYFGPRLMAIAAFLLCVAITVSIVRVLVRVRYAWFWGLLLATATQPIGEWWVLQLRGDFPAIFCGLTAMRLLMAKTRYTTVVLAGLFAGFATQFKFVYVTSLVACSLWLLLQKKFREFGLFAAAGSLTSAGLYFLFWLREPRMLAQILALSPGIPDYPGLVRNLLVGLETPVVPLALTALPFVSSRVCPRWMLLLLYAAISFAIATITGIQAGANINYYFEMLFAIVPLATVGTFQLLEWSRSNTGLALFLAGLTLTQLLIRETGTEIWHSGVFHQRSAVRAWNDSYHELSTVLRGQKVLSTVPFLALLDPQPALVEPFLAAYERKIGKFDDHPLMKRVTDRDFDVVITSDDNRSYRGVPKVDPPLLDAVTTRYEPYCRILQSTVNIPRSRQPNRTLLLNLRNIGCKPIVPPDIVTDFCSGKLE